MLTPSILVADRRESPDIAEIHSEPDDRQQEVGLLVPLFSIGHLFHRDRLRFGVGFRCLLL